MPALYFFIRNIKAAGGKTADEMKNNAEDNLHNYKLNSVAPDLRENVLSFKIYFP
jgi:hypothetical protein